MNQMRQALEFVTITNPEEIKDPKKQKAIRRQARRRDDGSKSLSRKPIRITFDLPGNDRMVSADQSISRHRETSPYAITPAEYFRANAVSPLLNVMQPLSPSCGCVFASPVSHEMTTRAVQLMNFIRHGADGSFCPLMGFWWSIGQLDSTAFFVTLANASRLINKTYPFDPRESHEAIKLYTNSIQCLQKRLQTPVDGISEGVIVSILEFAYYDFLIQNLTRWLIHMSGLVHIIRRRGGIQTLYSSEMILLLNFWIDVSGSFIFDNPPFFPPPYHLLTQVANTVSPNRFMQKWNDAFPELSDITIFLSHAADLFACIDARAKNAEVWRDDIFVAKTFNPVVHQLLSLERHTQISSPQLYMREAMRRALMIIFGMLRDKVSVHPSGISQHKNQVKELLLQHPVDWSSFLDLRLWVLTIAGLAADGEEISWYINEINANMAQMGISGWDDVLGVVNGILWMDEIFRSKSHLLKGLIEMSAVTRQL